MASDIYYDSFDYNSSQDYSDIDYQIDLFEIRQYSKSKKSSKQKLKKSSCPISMKTLKSQPILMKTNCRGDEKTPKAERKIFRYNRYPTKPKLFECDEEFQIESPIVSKNLQSEHLNNFFNFRRHFYGVNHEQIKSSFKDQSNIEIVNIRPAPINESVQKDFMKKLNENTSYFPQLVYHGTRLENIESILQYGFLIPNQAHPTNSKAPIIKVQHGQSFGKGIYCSKTSAYSLAYLSSTNTLLVCAAIPNRDKKGYIKHFSGTILVLNHVSRIIPLFFIDFKSLNTGYMNQPLFTRKNELKIIEKEKIKQPVVISRKYLRKVLNYMNDQGRKNNQYQMRRFDSFN